MLFLRPISISCYFTHLQASASLPHSNRCMQCPPTATCPPFHHPLHHPHHHPHTFPHVASHSFSRGTPSPAQRKKNGRVPLTNLTNGKTQNRLPVRQAAHGAVCDRLGLEVTTYATRLTSHDSLTRPQKTLQVRKSRNPRGPRPRDPRKAVLQDSENSALRDDA